jgi:hypothetical protein
MQAKTWSWSSLLLLLAGCGSDPATSRLATGSSAMLFDESRSHVVVADRPAAELKGVESVPVGTHVTVLADDEKSSDISGKDYRDVRISVREGPHQGYVGKVNRYELRPVK